MRTLLHETNIAYEAQKSLIIKNSGFFWGGGFDAHLYIRRVEVAILLIIIN